MSTVLFQGLLYLVRKHCLEAFPHDEPEEPRLWWMMSFLLMDIGSLESMF